METMDVQVNGETRAVPSEMSLLQLLEVLNITSSGVAVAIDRRIVPREDHAGVILTAGSSVEIVRAVGGG
jgi:thiamine biosynthesis protein ThiS